MKPKYALNLLLSSMTYFEEYATTNYVIYVFDLGV